MLSLNFFGNITELGEGDNSNLLKKIICILFLFFCFLILASSTESREIKTVHLKIEDLFCAEICPMKIEQTLMSIDGVAKAKVNYREKRCMIIFDPEFTNLEILIYEIEQIGFKAKPMPLKANKERLVK
jgi:copper chaperone CopZ